MTSETLTPETDAERLLADQLGKEGGIRLKFVEQLLEGIRGPKSETHEAALSASGTGESVAETGETTDPPQNKIEAPQKYIPKNLDRKGEAFVSKLIRGEISGLSYEQFAKFAKDPKNGLFLPERGDIPIPTDEEFERMLIEMFSRNSKGFETTKRMDRAMPLLGADLAWPIHLAILNANKKKRFQLDAHNGRANAFAEQDRILNLDPNNPQVTKWIPKIIESAPKLPFRSGLLRDVATEAQKELEEGGAKAPMGKEYAIMQSLATGLIDTSGWSMLREESTGNIIGQDDMVSGGNSYDWDAGSEVYFYGYDPELDCNDAVSRPVVMYNKS